MPLRYATSLRAGPGGAESNTAIGFTRLGGRAAWMGRVGDDEFGAMILSRLRGERLDIDAATVDDEAPTSPIPSTVMSAAERRGRSGEQVVRRLL